MKNTNEHCTDFGCLGKKLSKFYYTYMDACILSSFSEIVNENTWHIVYLSWNSSVHHPENPAVINCPLWGLCDLGICMNLSGSQFSELKNRDDTCLWELCATEEPSLGCSTNFERHWLHGNPFLFSPLDCAPFYTTPSNHSLGLSKIIILVHCTGSVFIYLIQT